MSFIPANQVGQFKKLTDEPKFGTVVSNEDPEHLGRIKVRIEGMYDGSENSLPWVRRKNDTSFCGNDAEMFDVPEVGSIVEVKWNYDDNTPMYSGAPQSKKHVTGEFTDNYPYLGGFKFGGNLIRFDKGSNSIEINNGEVQILLDGLGDLGIAARSVDVRSDVDVIIAAPNVVVQGNLTVTGSITSTNGASGVISAMNVATVDGGIVVGIE